MFYILALWHLLREQGRSRSNDMSPYPILLFVGTFVLPLAGVSFLVSLHLAQSTQEPRL